MELNIDKFGDILNKILFGLESGDDVIVVENDNYKINAKRTKAVGLIEELQIGVGNNLGVNSIIAKKLRDGILNGVKDYLKAEEKVAKSIKQATEEDAKVEEEIKIDEVEINEIAKNIDKPTKVKSKK